MDVWSRSGRTATLGERQGAVGELEQRACGGGPPSPAEDPRTRWSGTRQPFAAPRPRTDARLTEPAPARKEICSSGRSRLARSPKKTDVCRRPRLTRTYHGCPQMAQMARIRAVEDYPRNLAEFEARFASERACREYLCQLRWPQGFRCPQCGRDKSWTVRSALYALSALRLVPVAPPHLARLQSRPTELVKSSVFFATEDASANSL